MRVIIAVPFFNTQENCRAAVTCKTLQALRKQVNDTHVIVGVDNGSIDKGASATAKQLCDVFIELSKPHSVAYGLNIAWKGFESELMAGTAASMEVDSDVYVYPDDWLDKLLDVALDNPKIGILGPYLKGCYYDEKQKTVDHGCWFESSFVYGCVRLRTPSCFKAIGYSWTPGGRWGWTDHYDNKRLQENTKLVLGVVKDIFVQQRCRTGSLLDDEKERIIATKHVNLNTRLIDIRKGLYPVYESFEQV